jgi:hypothetical protein
MTGKWAQLLIGSLTVAELKDLKVATKLVNAESTGMGYRSPQRTNEGADYTITATRYQRPEVLGQFAKAVAQFLKDGIPWRIKVYQSAALSSLIYEGDVIPDENTCNMSDGEHQTEDLTMVCSGDPISYAGVSMGS